MAFTNFDSSAGHRQISNEVIRELADLADRHGLRFSSEGGSLGAGDMLIKLRVRAADMSDVEDAAKRMFALECRSVGLEAQDYGAVFSTYNGTYKLTGVKPSRPKYPLLGICQRTGKTYKLPRSCVPNIIAARKSQPASQQQSSAAPTPTKQTDDRFADLAQF